MGLLAFLFYELESSRATHFVILKKLDDYNREIRAQQEKPTSIKKGDVKGDIFDYAASDVEILIFDSFLSEDALSGSLGCVQTNGSIQWIPDYEAKGKIDCNLQNSDSCYVPKSICTGEASNIVKYRTFIRYDLGNYFRITVRTLASTLLWVALCLTLYYRALIYVIYGRAIHNKVMNNA